MSIRYWHVIFLLLTSITAMAGTPYDLRCDYRESPLAVEWEKPGLSWRVPVNQTAYHIQAAISEQGLAKADLWDSGWMQGKQTTQIHYAGKPVPPVTRVFWRVRIRDEKGAVSDWSVPAWYETGLMNETQWQGAEWISCTRQRTSQMAPKELMGPWIGPDKKVGTTQSLVYAFDFRLSNEPVVYAGAWWASPSPTAIECTINGDGPKNSFRSNSRKFADFAFCVRPGMNRLKMKLAKPPKDPVVTFGMQIVFADGSERVIQSGPEWFVIPSDTKIQKVPVRVDCSYGVQPRGEATVFKLAPLAATWYKVDFSPTKPVTKARLYCCGLGYHVPYVNGKQAGDHVLDPGQSDYNEIALYEVFDVTGHLQSGNNTLAVLLGDGWYNQDRGFNSSGLGYGKPGLRGLLRIQYQDGTVENIITTRDWKWRESETQFSNVYIGDRVDFRLAHDEWKQPGFSSRWKPVGVVPPLSPTLQAQAFTPIRKVRTILPVKKWQTGSKTWVFDLGQNISGWVRLKFNEPQGTVLRIRCTEMLDDAGRYLENVPKSFWWCHGSVQSHELICDGKARTWETQFSYHGFQYFEVTGLSRVPQVDDIVGVVVHTDTPVTATFESSDPLLNRIFKMGVQTHLNNMHSILEDCPHREKCMWGGDLHSSWAVGFHTLDSTTFYRQLVDLYYTPPFSKKGIPGNVGVGKRLATHYSDFTWAVSPLFLTYRLYQVDGELETARRNYAQMRFFLQYFEKNAPDLIPQEAAHGDHAAPLDIERAPQDKHLIAAMNFFAAAMRFSELAAALDRPEDATWAKDLAGRIRISILSKYYDSQNHTFGNGTHDSLALAFGIPRESQRSEVAQSLIRVYQENGKKFDGGFMSYFIYPQLTENGQVDLALEMLRNDDYPGLAWSINKFGATTIWEKFVLDKEMRQDRSLDHHAMNHPSAWLVTHLAGIQANHGNIVLAPHIPEALDWAKATVGTLTGTIESQWQKQGGLVKWRVVLPPNCTAQVHFPESASQNNKVISSGKHEFRWDQE